MDEICIKNLEVFANHGVYPEEKTLGQKFVITASIGTELRTAGLLDDLDKSVNYGVIVREIAEFVENNTWNLIETAAERLAEKLLIEHSRIKNIKLTIEKPWAPVRRHLSTVAVSIERSRHTAYLSLGSNMGDKLAYLQFAVSELNNASGCTVKRVSPFILTEPYGEIEQDDFLNGCLELETLLTPLELLRLIHEIEQKAGRVRTVRWGPRTLDLDILFYDELILNTFELTLPHIELHKREFVLNPLNEIAPFYMHPVLKKTVSQMREAFKDSES